MIFFTSDTHYGHANVIKYCNRPFANVHEMEGALISNWNLVVGKNDTVYHLGDFGFQKPADLVAIIGKLNGHIKLVPGNHDGSSFLNKLYELPEDKVQVMERYIELYHEGRKFVLCHYPIESWNNMSHGSVHLHGHSHGNSRATTNRFDVGVDVPYNRYSPVPINVFIDTAKDQVSRPDRIQRDV